MKIKWLMILVCNCMFATPSFALTYDMPYPGDAVIGHIRIIQAQKGDSLYSIARENEMGFNEMASVNPRVVRHRPFRASIALTIPSSFILPNTPHRDVVINLPELRLYYYSDDHHKIVTEPIAIGRLGWDTPLMETYVAEKIIDPYWVVPESIMDYSAQKGIFLPKIMPPGPKNPLGHFALRLGDWSILIHGTNQPSHIGKRVSSGCIRMYPEDIANLFKMVPKRTPVMIVDQPYKIGWKNNNLYLEVHPPLDEYKDSDYYEKQKVYQLIYDATFNRNIHLNWQTINRVIAQKKGIPYLIGS